MVGNLPNEKRNGYIAFALYRLFGGGLGLPQGIGAGLAGTARRLPAPGNTTSGHAGPGNTGPKDTARRSACFNQEIRPSNCIFLNGIKPPLAGIMVADIEWITKKGGFPSPQKWAVLYPEKDTAVISKILDMIHANADFRRSTEEDLDFLKKSHGYSVNLIIRLKDGREFSLKPAMKLETRETGNGTETTGITYRDRFILAYPKNGGIEYYTVFSEEAAAYILAASNPDFPRVDK